MTDTPIDANASPESRRSFLGRTAWVAPASLLMAGMAATPAQARNNGGGGRGRLPELFPGWLSRNYHEIQADENAHVDALVSALGAQARPKPTFQGLDTANIQQFATLAFTFENTGAAAYLGAAPVIFDKGILFQAASIALVEAYHSGFINTSLNAPITPGARPFIYSLTQEQVVQSVSPFIVSLNGGPPPAFSLTPSAQNDIAILNFALVLEYLEREFYNINVPKYFGS